MKLLILTEGMDEKDPSLGYFVSWVREFAKHFPQIIVVCLKEGAHEVPANVRVLSLGKEGGESRGKYVSRLFQYAWQERYNYDAVYVHQSQEYPMIAGWFWSLLGKKVYMWRNHYAGDLGTEIAGSFCSKIFCTSKHSYTARFPQTRLMPVGVDLGEIKNNKEEIRNKGSILSLGRVAPSKKVDVLVQALAILKKKGVAFSADIYGPTLPEDGDYRKVIEKDIVAQGMSGAVVLHEGVPHAETPALYASHEIFVNLAASGMYDKTLFEAAASGTLVVALSDDFAALSDPRFTPRDASAEAVADTLQAVLELPEGEKEKARAMFRAIAEKNSLSTLAARLAEEITL